MGQADLGAGACAVHDGVAAIHRERVLELLDALFLELILNS